MLSDFSKKIKPELDFIPFVQEPISMEIKISLTAEQKMALKLFQDGNTLLEARKKMIAEGYSPTARLLMAARNAANPPVSVYSENPGVVKISFDCPVCGYQNISYRLNIESCSCQNPYCQVGLVRSDNIFVHNP